MPLRPFLPSWLDALEVHVHPPFSCAGPCSFSPLSLPRTGCSPREARARLSPAGGTGVGAAVADTGSSVLLLGRPHVLNGKRNRPRRRVLVSTGRSSGAGPRKSTLARQESATLLVPLLLGAQGCVRLEKARKTVQLSFYTCERRKMALQETLLLDFDSKALQPDMLAEKPTRSEVDRVLEQEEGRLLLDALTARELSIQDLTTARSTVLHSVVATACARGEVRATLARLGATRSLLRAGGSRCRSRALQAQGRAGLRART